MTKRFYLIISLILLTFSAFAENNLQREKIVTTKWSLISGTGKVVNHYLSNQEYKGQLMGLGMEFGSFYKRSENLSWDLDLSYIMSPYIPIAEEMSMANPARTAYNVLHAIRADYGTYYNWNPIENFYIKAGGRFDLLAGVNFGRPNQINNLFDIDFQTQIKAAAGIRYGWELKRIGIYIQGDLAIPFIGGALGSGQYESSTDSLIKGEILPGTMNIYRFTSFHNLTGFDTEFELDFVFGNTTLFLSAKYDNRWWNITGVQNYRLYNLTKIGLMVDLVARNRNNSNNRYF